MLRHERICSCSSRENGWDRLFRNNSAKKPQKTEDGYERLGGVRLCCQGSSCADLGADPRERGWKRTHAGWKEEEAKAWWGAGLSPGTQRSQCPYLFPAAAIPALGRSPSALVSWGFWWGMGPGRTEARVPTSQTPPCPSSGLDTCFALGDLEVEEVGAWGPRPLCPRLAGTPGPLVTAPSAGLEGSGESGLGLAAADRLGVAADVLALYTLPSKGSSDLPLQSREHTW